MPLSDHEQRLLDQIEQALYADDPKFGASVRSRRVRFHARRALILGALGVVAGLAMVLGGLVTNLIVLSVAGFVLVVAASAFAAQVVRSRAPMAPTGTNPQRGKPVRPTGLRTRMEDRVRRRFDES